MDPTVVQSAPVKTGLEPEPPKLDAPDGRLGEALRHAATRAVLLAALLVTVGLLFHELVTLVAAVVITIILAIVLSAYATPLERRGVPRPIGALLGLLSLVLVVVLVFALVLPPLASQVEEFAEDLPRNVNELARQFASITGGEPSQAGDRVQKSFEEMTSDPGRYLGPIASVGLNVAGILSFLVVVVITAFYMAAMPTPLVSGFVRLFPPARRDWAMHLLMRLRDAWAGWLRGVAVDMVVTGILIYAGLTLIGVRFAVLFAVLSALLVVVPYFGAIAGAFPPVLLALTESPTLALMTLAVYVVVQQIEGNVIVPLVMSRVTNLHPALIALGVVVVAQLFGIVGLFVAVPILSAFVILVEELWVKPLEITKGAHVPIEVVGAADRADDGRFERV